MPGFADSPLVGPGSELQLTIDAGALPHADVVAEGGPEPTSTTSHDVVAELVELAPEVGEGQREELELELAAAVLAGRENLFLAGERVAGRGASPATRRQYASIHRAFGDWLMGELGRPPLVGDMDADAIAAYSRHLEARGGRGGRPAAPATRRHRGARARACTRPHRRRRRARPGPQAGPAGDADRHRLRQPAPRVERSTRFTQLVALPDGHRAEPVRVALAASIASPQRRRSDATPESRWSHKRRRPQGVGAPP